MNFDDELKELEQILHDKSSDSEMKNLAEKELDWKPNIELEEGLVKAIEYFKTII